MVKKEQAEKFEERRAGSACGIYIHVPFCNGKCPYCDFYSIRGTEERMEEYTNCIEKSLKYESEHLCRPADTLYFGGGTPGLLGAARLSRLISAARGGFGLENAEITVEMNPGDASPEFFHTLREAGANRLSVGLQSASEEELRLLGRRHSVQQAADCVREAQSAGFDNISLDLMLAVQGQTQESLRESIAFCANLGIQHISAYLLKIEPGTAYYKDRAGLLLPDEDAASALYLLAVEELERRGFHQYEISNFAQTGRESRHNLKYWHCEEYLGIGPAAHSFLNGERFYFSRSIGAFLRGEAPVSDGEGGNFEEYAMLALRLTEGMSDGACMDRFGYKIPERMKTAAKRFERAGLTACTPDGFHFTPAGFLVSNALTAELLFAKE